MADQKNPSEILFIVGPNKVQCRAHRGLLSLCSIYWREYFQKNSNTDDIKLLDIDVTSFKLILSHINGTNVKNKINKQNMCQILHLSSKYVLLDLATTAKRIFEKSIDKTNIVQIYKYAQSVNDNNLKEVLWKWLSRKSKKVTSVLIPKILEILNAKLIAELLQTDCISIKEELIFTYCLDWLKTGYQKNTLNGTPQEIFAPFLSYIRFPLMSNKFLSKEVYLSGLLSDDELLGVFCAKALKDQKYCKFSIQRRRRQARAIDDVESDDDDGKYNADDYSDDYDADDEYQMLKYKVIMSSHYGGPPDDYQNLITTDENMGAGTQSTANAFIEAKLSDIMYVAYVWVKGCGQSMVGGWGTGNNVQAYPCVLEYKTGNNKWVMIRDFRTARIPSNKITKIRLEKDTEAIRIFNGNGYASVGMLRLYGE